MTSQEPERFPVPDPTLTTPAMRLQIMSTEHWSLLASRNLAWNESFTRAGMFLSTLSFAVVALALVGQATGFGEGFRLFALVVLPLVLFVGIGTMLRLDSANWHDAQCVLGMNRIRAGYLELAPDLERYFVMGTTDDFAGMATTMAGVPGRSLIVHMLSASPTLIWVLNAVLTAAIVALALMQVEAGADTGLLVGAIAFLAVFSAQAWLARRQMARVLREHRPTFPAESPRAS